MLCAVRFVCMYGDMCAIDQGNYVLVHTYVPNSVSKTAHQRTTSVSNTAVFRFRLKSSSRRLFALAMVGYASLRVRMAWKPRCNAHTCTVHALVDLGG